jgi:hypothetical protein
MNWAEYVACMAGKKCLQSFGRKPEEWKPLLRTNRRLEYRYIIEMVFTEMGRDDADWVHLAQDREQYIYFFHFVPYTKLYNAEWLGWFVNDELERICKETAVV